MLRLTVLLVMGGSLNWWVGWVGVRRGGGK